MWYEKKVKIREKRVVVKLYNKSNEFIRSIIMPTEMYPLPSGEIKCFSASNTVKCTDEKIIDIVNSVEYKVGKCFDNTMNLYNKLYPYFDSVKMYSGWLFIENNTPVWHSWIVYKDNQIIDLTNNNDEYNIDEFCERNNNLSYEDMIMKYYKELAKLKNSETTFIGNVNSKFFYVGVECDAYKGKNFYQDLLEKYPNHETYSNCNKKTKLNRTQQILKDNGMYE